MGLEWSKLSPSSKSKLKKIKSVKELEEWALFYPPGEWDPREFLQDNKDAIEAMRNIPALKNLFLPGSDDASQKHLLAWNYQKFLKNQKRIYVPEQAAFIVAVENLQVMVEKLGTNMPKIGEKWPEKVSNEMKRMSAKFLNKDAPTRIRASDIESGDATPLNLPTSLNILCKPNSKWNKGLSHRTAENDPRLGEHDIDTTHPSAWIRAKSAVVKLMMYNYVNLEEKAGAERRWHAAKVAEHAAKVAAIEKAARPKWLPARAMSEGYGSDYVGLPSWYGDSQQSSMSYGLPQPLHVGYAGSVEGDEALLFAAMSGLSIVLGLLLCLLVCCAGFVMGYVYKSKPKVWHVLKTNADDEPRLSV